MKNKALRHEDYKERFKAATTAYGEYVKKGCAGSKGCSAQEVADGVNAAMLDGARSVRAAKISNHRGGAGWQCRRESA